MKKLIDSDKISNIVKLDDMSKTPKIRVSFKLYEEKNQMVTLENLETKDCKTLIKFIDKIQKDENYIEKVNLGKIGKNNKLRNHKYIDKMIHLKLSDKFRLHGYFYEVVFYIICIDPYHELHSK